MATHTGFLALLLLSSVTALRISPDSVDSDYQLLQDKGTLDQGNSESYSEGQASEKDPDQNKIITALNKDPFKKPKNYAEWTANQMHKMQSAPLKAFADQALKEQEEKKTTKREEAQQKREEKKAEKKEPTAEQAAPYEFPTAYEFPTSKQMDGFTKQMDEKFQQIRKTQAQAKHLLDSNGITKKSQTKKQQNHLMHRDKAQATRDRKTMKGSMKHFVAKRQEDMKKVFDASEFGRMAKKQTRELKTELAAMGPKFAAMGKQFGHKSTR